MQPAGNTTARRSWSKLARRLMLGGLFLTGTGCHRSYYYYGESAANCPPPMTSSVVGGSICDNTSPVIEGGTVVSSATESPRTQSKSRKSKVVVSEAGSGGKSSWKATDPESSVARTQVSGDIDDSIFK